MTNRVPAAAQYLLIACVLLGGILRFANLGNVRTRTPDETVYTTQAQALVQDGIAGTRALAAEYERDATRLYPPPSRIGYPLVVALAMTVSGRSDAVPGAWVSSLASVAGLVLIAIIGVQFLNPWAAVIGTFLLAVFPPDLVVARRAWSEAWVSLLAYTLLFCALSLSSRRSWRWLPAVFIGAGVAFVLTKETSLVVWGICLLWVVYWQGWASRGLVLGAASGGLLALGFLAWAVGSVPILWDIFTKIGPAHAANPYALDYQHGPPHWLFEAFWITSPWTFTLALSGLAVVPLWGRGCDRRSAVGLAGFVLVFLGLPLVLPNWLSLRFASSAFGPLCLLAGGTLCLGFQELKERVPGMAPTVIGSLGMAGLLFVALKDYRYFTEWFVQKETADLSVRMVFETAGKTVPNLSALQASPPQPAENPEEASNALDQSLQLFREKRYAESLEAARHAIALRPDYAEAYNNMAAAYEELGRWDEAIEAAQEAVRLKPGFQLAQNNLAWARAQKAKAAEASR